MLCCREKNNKLVHGCNFTLFIYMKLYSKISVLNYTHTNIYIYIYPSKLTMRVRFPLPASFLFYLNLSFVKESNRK